MTSNEIKQKTEQYIMPTYGRFPVAIVSGKGAKLYDPEGTEYIDFTSGIGVNCLGYGNEKWAKAVSEQALKLAHISNLFYTEPSVKVAEQLCKATGMDKVFFSNSGAESNEGAIKLARKYSFDKYGKNRSTVVTLQNSFHGRTITTLAATGQDHFHEYFFPFTEGFKYTPANDIKALSEALTDDVCALMIEIVQGEGGVLPMDKDFVTQAAKLCAERDILLIVDEVQTGIGRTGTLFAFMQYGISPDVVTTAKGLAGGLPIGAVMANAKCSTVLSPGLHATTFGANPLCTAAANTTLEIIDDSLLSAVIEKGNYIKNTIDSFGLKSVKGTRGMGLMIGVIVTCDPKKLAAKLIESGLLCLTAGNDAIRFLPPLTITYEEIDAGLTIFKSVLEGVN